MYKNRVHYLYGEVPKERDTPKKQDESHYIMPRIGPDYFIRNRSKFEAHFQPLQVYTKGYTPATSTRAPGTAARVLLELNGTSAASSSVNNATINPLLSSIENKENDVPGEEESGGYAIIDLDCHKAMMDTVHAHSLRCRHHLKEVSSPQKYGYTLKYKYSCDNCGFKKDFQTSPPLEDGPRGKKPGAKSTVLNEYMSLGMYASGVTPSKGIDWFGKVGIVSPTPSAVFDARKRLKSVIHDVSLEELRNNRVEHNKVARESADYPGDVTKCTIGPNLLNIKTLPDIFTRHRFYIFRLTWMNDMILVQKRSQIETLIKS
jgi:hypothetical protein